MWPWCLYRPIGGQSGTFCSSACHRERGIFITLQLSFTQCALPGTKLSFVLAHNRKSVSSRLKEVVLLLYSSLGSPSLDTAALEFPRHNPEEGERASEAKAHGMIQKWGILASMRRWPNKADQTCSLKSAQLKISCSMGDSDQLQGKGNCTIRMLKLLDKS